MHDGRECRLTFERPVLSTDGLGTPVPNSWQPIARVWGWRAQIGDGAGPGPGGPRAMTVRFRVRWRRSLAGLTLADQVHCEGLTYAIVGVKELDLYNGRDSRRQWLDVTAAANPDAV